MTTYDNNSYGGDGKGCENPLNYIDLGQSTETWVNSLPTETPTPASQPEETTEENKKDSRLGQSGRPLALGAGSWEFKSLIGYKPI